MCQRKMHIYAGNILINEEYIDCQTVESAIKSENATRNAASTILQQKGSEGKMASHILNKTNFIKFIQYTLLRCSCYNVY